MIYFPNTKTPSNILNIITVVKSLHHVILALSLPNIQHKSSHTKVNQLENPRYALGHWMKPSQFPEQWSVARLPSHFHIPSKCLLTTHIKSMPLGTGDV